MTEEIIKNCGYRTLAIKNNTKSPTVHMCNYAKRTIGSVCETALKLNLCPRGYREIVVKVDE